tara:strand:- start:768 stop:956 length:189 start_codon:yes stop_codon:yes gene_type:complete
MPSWLRNFTYSQIVKSHEEENAAITKNNSKNNKKNSTTLMDSEGNVNKQAAAEHTKPKTSYK